MPLTDDHKECIRKAISIQFSKTGVMNEGDTVEFILENWDVFGDEAAIKARCDADELQILRDELATHEAEVTRVTDEIQRRTRPSPSPTP